MPYKSLFGDDIFISYSRRDGALYAAGIADQLTQRKLSCFIDKLGVEPNHDLPPSLIKKIKNCTVFVLIGTEGASVSKFVAKEIEEFKQTGRTILPVDFNGAVGRAHWYELIPGLPTEAEKDPAALETGNPSTNVISFIEKSFKYTRRNQRMFRWLLAALSVFLVLVVLSVVFIFIARNQVAKAATAERVAKQRDEEARASQKRADAAGLLAEQMQKKADEATEEARKKREEADRATRLAEEKTLLAQKAEGKARAAEGRQRVAEARATEQEQIATSRELAAASLSLLPVDPEASLRQAEVALGHAHTEQAENAFRGALFESHVRAVIPGPFTSLGAQAFDPSGKLSLLGGSDGKVRVIEAGTGAGVGVLTAPPAEKFRKLPATADSSGTQSPDEMPYLTGTTFSPTGNYVAAAEGSLGHRRAVYLWEWNNAASHDRPRVLHGTVPDGVATATCSLECRIISIAFSPDGKYLAGAGENGVVWVWETATGEQKHLMSEHDSAINRVSFSPDGRYIISAGQDGKAILWAWNPERGATGIRTLPHADRPVGLAVFSPLQGEYIVTTSEKHVQGPTFARIEAGEAWVWETSTGGLITRLSGHSGVITGVEFSPDQRFIVTASSDGTARVWDWQSPIMSAHPAILSGHTGGLMGAHFSPIKGQYVLTYGWDNTARLWKPETARSAAESGQISVNIPALAVMRGHMAVIESATFSPDEKSILTVGADQTARFWRMEGEQVIASLPAHPTNIQSASFGPDASLVVTTTLGLGPVRVWNWEALGKAPPKLLAELLASRNSSLRNASFSPDGKFIAASAMQVGSTYSTLESDVAVWEWAQSQTDPLMLGGCRNIINSVAFSHDPEGRYVVAAGGGARSGRTGDPLSPGSNIVCIWDRRDEAGRNNPLILHKGETPQAQDGRIFWSAVFSPDNRYVVASLGSLLPLNGAVLVWDWQSKEGRSRPVVLNSASNVMGDSFSKAVFSPDGKYIAAAGGGNTVAMLWKWLPEEERGNPVFLRGHDAPVTSVAFSPDGTLILTSSADGTERLWSVNTGRSLATISGHTGQNDTSSFSRDGRFILTTDGRTAHVHACEKCAGLDELKRLAQDYLLPQSPKLMHDGTR
ncbi:MAG TPA: TIR domain-containing protein [Pyrinomonadaceae bacterium]|nr:TIR domain-containing protein [Pyrinomonadaceae bacterium]